VHHSARFDTEREALACARVLELRCATIRDKRVAESDDPFRESFGRNLKAPFGGELLHFLVVGDAPGSDNHWYMIQNTAARFHACR
jgi:hypothetical protein